MQFQNTIAQRAKEGEVNYKSARYVCSFFFNKYSSSSSNSGRWRTWLSCLKTEKLTSQICSICNVQKVYFVAKKNTYNTTHKATLLVINTHIHLLHFGAHRNSYNSQLATLLTTILHTAGRSWTRRDCSSKMKSHQLNAIFMLHSLIPMKKEQIVCIEVLIVFIQCFFFATQTKISKSHETQYAMKLKAVKRQQKTRAKSKAASNSMQEKWCKYIGPEKGIAT